MSSSVNANPEWVTKGKSIRKLIQELQTFENQDMEVRLSLDGGTTHKPISIVGKYGEHCLLVNSETDI